MVKTYTRKSDIRIILDEVLVVYDNQGLAVFLDVFHEKVLAHKVKFPLLEFCGKTIRERLNEAELLPFLDEVCKRKTEGGNVILGIILQGYLPDSFQLAFDKASEYIGDADKWYVCDLIGERVFGYGLLTDFDQAFPAIKKLSRSDSNWVVRSLGAGGHYAIKKGLRNQAVDQLFLLLMSMADTNDKEVRQGVGWAAKTTAKFHPDIIKKYREKIDDPKLLPNWFRKKIEIGLYRSANVSSLSK